MPLAAAKVSACEVLCEIRLDFCEVACKMWTAKCRCESLLQIVVLVDCDRRKPVGAQTNHDALCGKTRCFVGRAGVGDNNDPIGAYNVSVVDAEPIAFAPEAFDDRVDHDQVFDLWCCQHGF